LHPVAAVRSFNRFYTRQIGLLNERLYDSALSLSEVRVLYELAHRETSCASELTKDLGLDTGYLSRLLSGFEKQGLLAKTPAKQDRRQLLLTLTSRGQEAFARIDAASHREIGSLLSKLSATEQKRLVDAMAEIQRILGDARKPQPPYILRPHQPGDLGWIVHRHGVLYSQEYGYDERFEALVAQIVAEFVQNLDPRREHCWIAEKDGENVGCVMLVKKSKTVAKLRLLLVEPSARGMGIGRRLVEECIRFARRSHYKKIMLWTQSELDSARHIYREAGFRLVGKEPHNGWSRNNLIAETWELKL
jgi:DNA-binding MarR family transcriptional regulator/N-acetylglutamate synthase-like GNAT family acetyltransferase